MKKLFVLSMFTSLAMICSCQKQDSGTEAQLAQRKTELDAREEALVQREKAVDAREKAVAAREKAMASARAIIQSRRQAPDTAQLKASPGQAPDPAQWKAARGQASDPAQFKADREKMLQQLPPQVQALIPDAATVQAQRDRVAQKLEQRRRRLEELGRTQPQMQMNPANQAAIPAATAAPAAVYPGAEATSPSPSPTPQ